MHTKNGKSAFKLKKIKKKEKGSVPVYYGEMQNRNEQSIDSKWIWNSRENKRDNIVERIRINDVKTNN